MITIQHSGPWIVDDDVDAVARVLRSRMLAQGTLTAELERRLASWCCVAGGVAVASGSAAIELALRALKVEGGDVVLPTYVCRSVLEAVVSAGARPILGDVGEDWVMEPANVASVITKTTRCIIVPHMYGVFADIDAFRAFGVPLLEDAAQAVGSARTRPTVADVAVFSLHPTKCLTAGEGGCAVSHNAALLAEMRKLRDGHPGGTASRMFSPLPDVSAALALSQLERYADFLRRRAMIASKYDRALGPERQRLARPTMHFRYVVRVPGGHAAVVDAFAARGVAIRKGVDELLHRLVGMRDSEFPVAVRHFEASVSLPIYPALSDDEIACCATAAAAVLGPTSRTKSERRSDEQAV